MADNQNQQGPPADAVAGAPVSGPPPDAVAGPASQGPPPDATAGTPDPGGATSADFSAAHAPNLTGVGDFAKQVGVGLAKNTESMIEGGGYIIRHVLGMEQPNDLGRPALQKVGPAQELGGMIGDLIPFMAGEKVFDALAHTDQILEAVKAAKVLEKYPKVQALIRAGISASRAATVQSAQTLVNTGGDTTQAAGSAETMGAVSGALGVPGELLANAAPKVGEAAETYAKMQNRAEAAPTQQEIAGQLQTPINNAISSTEGARDSAIDAAKNKQEGSLSYVDTAHKTAQKGVQDSLEEQTAKAKGDTDTWIKSEEAKHTGNVAKAQEGMVHELDQISAGAKAPEEMATEVNDALNKTDEAMHSKYEEGITGENGIETRIGQDVKNPADKGPIAESAGRILNSPVPGDSEDVARAKKLAGDALKPATAQFLKELSEGMYEVGKGDDAVVKTFDDRNIHTLVQLRQSVRAAAAAAGRGTPDATKLYQLIDPIDSEIEQLAKKADNPSSSGLSYESKFIPDGTGKTSGADSVDTFAKDQSGKQVGKISVDIRPDMGDGHGVVSWSNLDESLKGKGLAKELYANAAQSAKAQGLTTLQSDGVQSGDARKVWESLEKRGIAVKAKDIYGQDVWKIDLSNPEATKLAQKEPQAGGILSDYQKLRSDYKETNANLESTTAQKLSLDKPDKAMKDVGKWLMTGQNAPAKIATMRKAAGSVVDDVAKSTVQNWKTMAEEDPTKFLKEFDKIDDPTRQAMFGPEMTDKLQTAADNYRNAISSSESARDQSIAAAKTSGEAAQKEAQKNSKETLSGLSDAKDKYDKKINTDYQTAVKDAQDKAKAALTPTSNPLMKHLAEGRVDENLFKGNVDVKDIQNIKAVIGQDSWDKIFDKIVDSAIKDSTIRQTVSKTGAITKKAPEFAPDRFLNWIHNIDPQVLKEMTGGDRPEAAAKFQALVDNMGNAAKAKKWVSTGLLYGPAAGIGGTAFAVANALVPGFNVAGLMGGLLGAATGIGGTRVKAIRETVDYLADHPALWNAASRISKISKAVAPVAKPAIKKAITNAVGGSDQYQGASGMAGEQP